MSFLRGTENCERVYRQRVGGVMAKSGLEPQCQVDSLALAPITFVDNLYLSHLSSGDNISYIIQLLS